MSLNNYENPELTELRKIVAFALDIDEELVTNEADFVEDLDLDSLMALEVMVTLEKKYQIKLEEQEIKQINCLSNIYELVKTKQGQNAKAS
ncbi:acyl carrier protein [Nostoc favosum]|uniref:Acyl carrier protein n=1 Tax=Nostoc favosum CHAB5714 TaxID=2780399 RepID=A0ABS8IHL4_9NOSO|nr:acyl carrier protein [Nostoc favosum]MCC5603268.1 acyl carrier protein [Nostoc favosum CHAB5714]